VTEREKLLTEIARLSANLCFPRMYPKPGAQKVAKMFAGFCHVLGQDCPRNKAFADGLQKLLEARDLFVAAVDSDLPEPEEPTP
jgi:hypothetical protein